MELRVRWTPKRTRAALAATSGLKQPYHLVDPSPWPIIGAAGGGMLLTGIVFAAHWHNYLLLAAGLAAGAVHHVQMVERRAAGEPHAGPAQPGGAAGPALRHDAVHQLRGDVLRRASSGRFSITRFSRSMCCGVANPTWPPPGIHTFDPFRVPFLNTMVLLLSGITVTWAHHALLENDRKNLSCGLGMTMRWAELHLPQAWNIPRRRSFFPAAASIRRCSSWPPAFTVSTSSSAPAS